MLQTRTWPSARGIGSRPYRATTIGSVALISLLAFETLAVSTAMPVAADALDGVSLYALAFGAPLAAGVIGMVAAGSWSDRSGPGPAIWTGLVAFVTGLVVAGTAQSMAVLVLGRTVQGTGAGLVSVALYVLVGRCYPPDLHPRIFAAYSAAWVVPSLVGPSISGFIAQHLGWRYVFLLVPVVAAPLPLLLRSGLRLVRPAAERPAPTGSTPRQLTWAVVAGLAACLLNVAGQQRLAVGLVLAALALTGLTLALPRLLPPRTLTFGRGLPAVVALRGLFAGSFFSAEVYIPLMLTHQRGLSPTLAGAALTVGAVSWSTGSWLQSRLSTARRRPVFLRVGSSAIVIATACAALTATEPVPVFVAVVGWAVAGLGMGISYPTLSLLALELAPAGRQGEASSSLQVAEALTSSGALALGGAAFAALVMTAPDAAYLAAFGIAGACALAAAVLAGRVNA
ncbi:MAG: MFS transporter [Nocardioidaceae bacterium]